MVRVETLSAYLILTSDLTQKSTMASDSFSGGNPQKSITDVILKVYE